MFPRRIKQRTKSGETRTYVQLVKSFRREDGMPSHEVIAHLGACDDILYENLRVAFAAARKGRGVVEKQVETPTGTVVVSINQDLIYLSVAVVSHFFRSFGLREIVDSLCPLGAREVPTATVLEALVAHRCVEPGSKLAFQRWIDFVAIEQVFGCRHKQLNNSRVHRALDELAAVDEQLQDCVARRIVEQNGKPRILYLDLTDTWFVSGGGPLARRGQTKEGHRSKRKINIALMVDEVGLPMRWELMPGALSETIVLPSWLPRLRERKRYSDAILVFDRGLPCIENFKRLVDPDEGRHFLTSIKSDAIPTYVDFDVEPIDALQELDSDTPLAELSAICERVGLTARRGSTDTFCADFGVVEPPKSNSRRKKRPPPMRMYLYFNLDIWRTKRENRAERLTSAQSFVDELNSQLAKARQPRKREPIIARVTERLRKLRLLEAHDIELEQIAVAGKTKPIRSYQVRIHPKQAVLRAMRRYDGFNLLVAHPDVDLSCEEAIDVYRQKNVVEADFRTIKSVLNLRPTFHWTANKIKAHVTLCVLALLVERLIEQRLRWPQGPRTASAALGELNAVRLHKIRIADTIHVCQTEYAKRVAKIVNDIRVQELLGDHPTHIRQKTS